MEKAATKLASNKAFLTALVGKIARQAGNKGINIDVVFDISKAKLTFEEDSKHVIMYNLMIPMQPGADIKEVRKVRNLICSGDQDMTVEGGGLNFLIGDGDDDGAMVIKNKVANIWVRSFKDPEMSLASAETAASRPTSAQLKAAIKKLSAMKSVQNYIKLSKALDRALGKAPSVAAKKPAAKTKKVTNRGVDHLDDMEEDMSKVNSSLKKVLAQVKAGGYPKAKIDGEGDLDGDASIKIMENKKGESISMQVGKGYFVINLNDAEGGWSWDAKSVAAALKFMPKALAEAKKNGIKF